MSVDYADPSCGYVKKNGEICRRTAGWGTPYDHGRCKTHGGNSPGQSKAAARMTVMAMATEADADPLEVLRKTIRVAWGSVQWIHEWIAADFSEDPQAIEEVTREKNGQEQTTYRKTEFITRQQILGEWTDRAAKYSKMALDAGVDERVVRVEEQRGALLAGVIKVILNGLVLTPEQQKLAPELVRRALLEIA